jgi:trimethylamine--corrinoid protein Co-methyltransferase
MSQARPRLRLLSREQVEEVHEGSLRILLEHGVGVDSERARRVFAGASGEVHLEDGRVRLERGVVEWAIRVSPPVVEVHDRHGAPAFRLGDDRTRFGVGVTNLWYQDPLTDELTPFSRADMTSGVRLAQALPSYDVISTLGVLRDLPPTVADLYAVLEMIANSTKPLVLLISDESLFPAALDLVEALHVGDDRPFVIPYLNPITPLRINQGTSDKLLDALERGLPAIYSNLGMAGMTTPITCAGTLALLNAELLAGLVLSQLAREGAGVILGSLPMFFDMKTMVDFCDPQTHLIDLACAEMMAHYRIPHTGTSGSGEGWGPDLLAAAPLWTNQLTSVLGKVGLCPFVGSSLSSKAFSPALTVLGDDVIGQARLLGKGFAVDEAAIGVTETLEVLRTDGQFLLAPTTLERYREACFAGIFPHIGLEKWEEEGRPPADRLVRERTRDLLAEAEPPEDHDELLARGEEFLRTRGLAAPD